MDDDFNTPEAFAVLQNLTREVNTAKAAGQEHRAAELAAELRTLAGLLGLAQLDPSDWLKRSNVTTFGEAQVEALIEARNAARRAKNWVQSDRIRAELAQAGIILEDKPGGTTTWRRA
jgi:cysteinyl-tRNA synthetase